jgi:hypothetical protein
LSTLSEFIEQKEDGVFYIGHASALARISQKLILFDPYWGHSRPYGDHWCFAPAQINCDEILEKVDACFISHIHADHVCEDVLSKLKCPIFIMEGRPNLKAKLEAICSSTIVELEKFKWAKINDQYEVYFVPHEFNAIDSSCFVRSRDFCVYHGNDNFLSLETVRKLMPEIGPVNVAMVPFAFIHWYPHLLTNITKEEREIELERLTEESWGKASIFKAHFDPDVVIPFGANLFYSGGMDHVLNKSLCSPFDITLDALVTGDWAVKKDDYFKTVFNFCGDGNGLAGREKNWNDKVRDEVKRHFVVKKNPHVQVRWDHIKRALLKLKAAKFTVPDYSIVVNDLVFNLDDLCVAYDQFPPANYIRFTIEPEQYLEWLEGRLTLEQVIGTRCFTAERVPNVYNPKVFDFMNLYL